VGAADRVAVPRRFRVPSVDASPEFIGRYVEVVQFNAYAKATSRCPELITFDSCPEPEIEDDAQAEAQNFLGEVPEFMFELHPGRLVPGVGAECNEPFILRKTHRAPVRRQLLCEGGLPRPRQPAGENQPSLARLWLSQAESTSVIRKVTGSAVLIVGRR